MEHIPLRFYCSGRVCSLHSKHTYPRFQVLNERPGKPRRFRLGVVCATADSAQGAHTRMQGWTIPAQKPQPELPVANAAPQAATITPADLSKLLFKRKW